MQLVRSRKTLSNVFFVLFVGFTVLTLAFQGYYLFHADHRVCTATFSNVSVKVMTVESFDGKAIFDVDRQDFYSLVNETGKVYVIRKTVNSLTGATYVRLGVLDNGTIYQLAGCEGEGSYTISNPSKGETIVTLDLEVHDRRAMEMSLVSLVAMGLFMLLSLLFDRR